MPLCTEIDETICDPECIADTVRDAAILSGRKELLGLYEGDYQQRPYPMEWADSLIVTHLVLGPCLRDADCVLAFAFRGTVSEFVCGKAFVFGPAIEFKEFFFPVVLVQQTTSITAQNSEGGVESFNCGEALGGVRKNF
jgi:hypothetical protein